MNDIEEVFNIIDEETFLSGDKKFDYDAVEDDLHDIAEENENVRKWIKDIGIDNAVHIVMERNKDPYNAVGKMVALITDLMKVQGSSAEEINKCANDFYEQYNVPVDHRRYAPCTKEKE